MQNFNQHRRRFEPRQRGQIAARFGMPGPRQYAAGLRGKWKNMPWLRQVERLRIRFHCDLNRARAIVRRNTRSDALRCFNRNSEVGVVLRGVVAHHWSQAKLACALLGQGETDQAACFAHHKVDVFRPHHRSGHDQIAFVLAIFVVEDHHHAPGANVVENFRNAIERHIYSFAVMSSSHQERANSIRRTRGVAETPRRYAAFHRWRAVARYSAPPHPLRYLRRRQHAAHETRCAARYAESD